MSSILERYLNTGLNDCSGRCCCATIVVNCKMLETSYFGSVVNDGAGVF